MNKKKPAAMVFLGFPPASGKGVKRRKMKADLISWEAKDVGPTARMFSMSASKDCAFVRHVDGDQVIFHEPIRRAFVTLQLDAEPDEGLLLTLLSRPGVEVTFMPGRART